jgi:HlyD family secretion protein
MTANVQFLVKEKKDALMIPNVALRFKPPEEKDEAQELLREERRRTVSTPGRRRSSRSGGGAREGRDLKIYVLRDSKAQPVDVQLGISDGSRTEVTSGGLNENDAVIIGMSSTTANTNDESGTTNPFRAQRLRGLGAFQ